MGYITLLSDLGLRDASVAIAKGILMQHSHEQEIIDITHDITPFNLQQAAYLLSAAYKKFPVGTYHVLLFDLFSEKSPSLLLCEHNGHYFLSPDNGVIPLALDEAPVNVIKNISFKKGDTFDDWIKAVANAIVDSESKQSQNHSPLSYKLKIAATSPEPGEGTSIVPCEIVHVDQFENVVLNITRRRFEALGQGRQFRLQFMRVEEINEVSTSYTDSREGYKLCRFNSNDYLEICINRGKAASLFGLRLGAKNNDIKIFFE